MREFVNSTELLTQPEALRQRAAKEGYLFFRGLLDRDAIRNVRRQILDLCARAGWLAAGTEPMDGIGAPNAAYVEPQPDFMTVYNEIMKLEDFHALAQQPALLAMFDTLFGEQTVAHARNIARIIFPQNTKFTTPAHQDYIHIQGTVDTWTAWIPLGDCPRQLGSLAIMPRSHTSGVYPVHDAYGAGGKGIDTDSLPYKWLSSDFVIGDVVLFQSLTVHKALPNLSRDHIRLSVDYRYQSVSEPAAEGSFQPHYGQLTWEEIYANWKSTRYQYYWREMPLRFVNWSPEYHVSAKAMK